MPDSMARKAFPGILSEFMSRNNLTQTDIAKKLNVSKQTVSDWVNGKKFPRVDKMQELANIFGVLMSNMYTYSEKNIIDPVESFSDDEKQLIYLYRGAENAAQQYALEMLKNHQRKDSEMKVI